MPTECTGAPSEAAPSRNDEAQRHALAPRRRQLLPAALHTNGMRWRLAGGGSCQQHWMQTACAEASPAATPANSPAASLAHNNACGMPWPRRRQILAATMDASTICWCLAGGSSCRQQWMHAACAEASPAAALASNTGCERHASCAHDVPCGKTKLSEKQAQRP